MRYRAVYIVTSVKDLDVPWLLSVLKEAHPASIERLEGVLRVDSPLSFLHLEYPSEIVILEDDPMYLELKDRFVKSGMELLIV